MITSSGLASVHRPKYHHTTSKLALPQTKEPRFRKKNHPIKQIEASAYFTEQAYITEELAKLNLKGNKPLTDITEEEQNMKNDHHFEKITIETDPLINVDRFIESYDKTQQSKYARKLMENLEKKLGSISHDDLGDVNPLLHPYKDKHGRRYGISERDHWDTIVLLDNLNVGPPFGEKESTI